MSNVRDKLQELESEFRKNQGDVDLAVSLAREHMDAGNDNRAREILDKILKTNMDAGEAFLARAEILARRHEWIEADRDYRLAAKAGTAPDLKKRMKAAYFRRLLMASEGWRPEKPSRIGTLIMSTSFGLLMIGMAVQLLIQGAWLGFILSFVMGSGFIFGGLMVGGLSLWLKDLQDRMTPGWDEMPQGRKRSKGSK